MTFDEVINDIEKMVGLELESIKPGANIKLNRIDKAAKRIELITFAGKIKTRPFSELEKIWNKICSSPAAHVDSVLGGSGSSRNQPETVMANLPYVEWFFIDGKKHLALVKEPTHGYGTLLRMDEVAAIEIKDKLLNVASTACEVVVITEDIKETAYAYEKITGIPLYPVSPGVYEQYKNKVRFIIVSKSNLSNQVKPGTYIVVSGGGNQGSEPTIYLDGREFQVFCEGGMYLLVTL
ncbi:hypothetical protein [Paenibacillus sp. S150]|uniref:hypothetical protein n=1 Tax=Paenibacillus sp. S150 TaxID=2749826 RepID=UPI001C576D86|nr:hypothetical protein [Paenibacillus sp. S150]MBW4081975.1 hypothetical protein [Paenibacillus sp. S150]